MDLLKQQTKAVIDFDLAFDLDKAIFKDAEGNLDLLGGKLEAGGVVAGTFTIKKVENQDSLFGKDKISPGDNSVTIENKNINKGSLINITATSDTQNQVLCVSMQDDGKFEVSVKEKSDSDITFNWWIMETK